MGAADFFGRLPFGSKIYSDTGDLATASDGRIEISPDFTISRSYGSVAIFLSIIVARWGVMSQPRTSAPVRAWHEPDFPLDGRPSGITLCDRL
ncbi:MAG: hypothetical protein HYS65_13930 [Betaproteobacteria bacterium]|nr:hypothetical protein [Betaproteobacteria bacterium]